MTDAIIHAVLAVANPKAFIMRRLRLYTSVFLVSISSFLCLVEVSNATNVKWTQGEHDEKNAAHTAPKSQKYWDEHGIERPDYAKTDAEIEKERGSGSSAFKWLLALPIIGAAGYYLLLNMGGKKLGGTAHLFRRISEEEARQARLAKFERAVGSGKAE